jgi:hypothetical protein
MAYTPRTPESRKAPKAGRSLPGDEVVGAAAEELDGAGFDGPVRGGGVRPGATADVCGDFGDGGARGRSTAGSVDTVGAGVAAIGAGGPTMGPVPAAKPVPEASAAEMATTAATTAGRLVRARHCCRTMSAPLSALLLFSALAFPLPLLVFCAALRITDTPHY